MRSPDGLAGIENRAWLRVFEDGLWDIGIGLILVGFGLPVLFDFPYVAAIGPVLAIVLLQDVKRRLIEPRIGRVRFAPRRQQQAKRIRVLLAVLVVLGGVVLAFMTWVLREAAPGWAVWIGGHFVAVLGLIWGAAMALAGWAVEFRRLYVYGLLVVGSLLASDISAGYSLGLALSAVGAVILAVGTFLLVRFLHRYPRLSAEGKE